MFTYYFCNIDIWKYTFFYKIEKLAKMQVHTPFIVTIQMIFIFNRF